MSFKELPDTLKGIISVPGARIPEVKTEPTVSLTQVTVMALPLV